MPTPSKEELKKSCELLYSLILQFGNSRIGAAVITKTPFADLSRDDRITIAEIVLSYHRMLDNPRRDAVEAPTETAQEPKQEPEVIDAEVVT